MNGAGGMQPGHPACYSQLDLPVDLLDFPLRLHSAGVSATFAPRIADTDQLVGLVGETGFEPVTVSSSTGGDGLN